MATWSKSRVDYRNVNGGNEFENGDGIRASDINKVFNGIFYTQDNLENQLANLGDGTPKYVALASTILSKTSNEGVLFAGDTQHKYFWNGTQYVDGGVYQASAIEITDKSISLSKLDSLLVDTIISPRFNLRILETYPGKTVNTDGYLINADSNYTTVDFELTEQGYDRPIVSNLFISALTIIPNLSCCNWVILNVDGDVIKYKSVNAGEYTDIVELIELPLNAYTLRMSCATSSVDNVIVSERYKLSDITSLISSTATSSNKLIDTNSVNLKISNAIKNVDKELESTNKELADLKEALYGYVLDITNVNIEDIIPNTVDIDSTTYNLVDNVRGKVSSINGNTEKSDNLIVLDDIEETTTKGITYSVKDGIITLNGTTTGANIIYLQLKNEIPIGDYSFALFNNFTLSSTVFSLGLLYDENNSSGGIFYCSGKNSSKNFTSTKTTNLLRLSFYSSNISLTNAILKPMIVSGSYIPIKFKPHFEGLKSVEYKGLEIRNADESSIINLLQFNTTLRGVGDIKDQIVITKNQNDNYYTATKITNCESVNYTSGDEDNSYYLTDLTTTIKPLSISTSEVLSTTLTEDKVLPLLEFGGSINIINSNSNFVNGSTTIEMVYKKINV